MADGLVPVVYCAVCMRPVDRFELTREFSRRRYVLTAYCHGQTETASLTACDMEDACAISIGVAFQAKSIEAGQ